MMMRILEIIFDESEIPKDFGNLKQFLQGGNNNKCCNYRGNSLIFKRHKLLNTVLFIRARYFVHLAQSEEGF